MTKLPTLLLASLVLASCASTTPVASCRPGEQSAVMDSLYFGTAMPEGQVKLEEWQRFLAEFITPRFPEGLTSWAAAGQWQSGDGEVQKESSYVLHVVHADSPQTDSAIREVVSVYKQRFRQQAVLRVRSPACISF